jgi:hypothetical protein
MRTQHLNLRRLFASDLSVRILASALEQQCETRMSFCRDLLILMHIISRLSARVSIWANMASEFKAKLAITLVFKYLYLFIGRSSFFGKLYNILGTRASCFLLIACILQFTVAFNTVCFANTT